jgi:hypothetical protein
MFNAAQKYLLILSSPVLVRLDRGITVMMGVDMIEGNRQDSSDTEN